jgi:hypothetical protein
MTEVEKKAEEELLKLDKMIVTPIK